MKTILKIAGILIALLILAAIAVPLLVNVNSFRPRIESDLGSALGRPVTVGNLSLTIFSGSVEADQLSIADDPKFGTTPFIQAKSLQVGVELMPLLFSKQLNITHILIDHPAITLERDRDGVWNFSTLGSPKTRDLNSTPAPAPQANLNVAKLDLSDGTVTVVNLAGKRKPIVYDNVNVTVRNFSFTNAFPVVASASLPGGGSLKIDGSAGPINPTDTTLTPVQAKVTLNKLDLAQSAIVDPDLGITGSADFDGTLASDGNIAKAKGTLVVTSLQLVQKGSPATVPIQVVFAVDHDLKAETGKLLQGDIAIGKALAKLTGTYDMHGETTSARTRLSGPAMPVDDLSATLPALGVILPAGSKLKGGTLSVELESQGPLNALVTAGSIKMSNTALDGFNLGSKLSEIAALTGKPLGSETTIENLSSNVRYAPEGARLDNIDLSIPALGTVTGAGTVSPSNELDFKMLANLSGGVAGDLTKVVGAGSGGIPITVTGTTADPKFKPDVKSMVGKDLKNLIPGGKNNPLGGLSGLFGKKKPH